MKKLVLALSLLLAIFASPVFAGEDAVESNSSISAWVSQLSAWLAEVVGVQEEIAAGDSDKDRGESSQFGVEIVPSG